MGREANSRCNQSCTMSPICCLESIFFQVGSHTQSISSCRFPLWTSLQESGCTYLCQTNVLWASIFLVGIPKPFQDSFDLLPQRMTYNWELVWSISYKQKDQMVSLRPNHETRAEWQVMRNLPQNDSEPWNRKAQKSLSWPLCKKDNASLLFTSLLWASNVAVSITITFPCLVQVHWVHTCPFGSESSSSRGTLCPDLPTFFWQFRLDSAASSTNESPDSPFPGSQFLLRSLHSPVLWSACSAGDIPVHYTWGGETVMPLPHSFVHPWLHGAPEEQIIQIHLRALDTACEIHLSPEAKEEGVQERVSAHRNFAIDPRIQPKYLAVWHLII